MKSSVTLIKGDHVDSNTDYRDSLPVNMIAIKKDILGAKGYMLAYPGLESFGIGSGIDRGGVYNERLSMHFRVSGEKLISVSSNGTVTILGDIPGSNQARLDDFYSFNTQGIIADGNFYLYSPGSGLNQVVDTDLGTPLDGVWIDFYYFMTDGDYIFHTDLADETSIDPLKYATAEFMPDPSIGVSKTQDNKAVVWGRYSVEYFINVASDNFAFTRIPSRAQKIGIVSTHAKVESSKGFYITGGRKNESIAVYLVGIGESIKVSTREIDRIIEQYTEPELADIRMEKRAEKDTNIIIIHLPNETLCFNETIAESIGKEYAWTILKTGLTGTANYSAINGVYDPLSSKWVYGDKTDNKIGFLSEVFTQYGDIQEWILYTPLIKLETNSINEILIETIPGHTTDIDAKVAFSITNNGLTYGTEYWQLYGQPMEYNQRFIIRILGYVGNWAGFKFRGATKSRMAFSLMEVDYS